MIIALLSSNLTSRSAHPKHLSDAETRLMDITFEVTDSITGSIETRNHIAFSIQHASLRINGQTAKGQVIRALDLDNVNGAIFHLAVKGSSAKVRIDARIDITIEGLDSLGQNGGIQTGSLRSLFNRIGFPCNSALH